MSIEQAIEFLDENNDVAESYVLVRQIKLFLNLGSSPFHPNLGIKIYRSSVINGEPYHFDVSHHVLTPEQAGPYFPSHTSAASETEAIGSAISTTTSFLKSAISKGLTPTEDWLVPNKNF